jgi:hypothetical protein
VCKAALVDPQEQKSMKKIDLKGILAGLAVVSIMSAMPMLTAYGQNAETPAKASLAFPDAPRVESKNYQTGEHDIVELLKNNIIEAEIRGGDITYVNLRLRRLVPGPVSVLVPVGSFFVSANSSAQNMVATGAKKVRLTNNGWQSVSIPAACANRPKDIPDSNDKFTVQHSPNQEELARLMPVINKSGAGTITKQAAVWIITDNADYDDLGILVSGPGNARVIGTAEAARAMKICADAGIDITKKNIWRDRESIMSRLPAGELKTWLKNLNAK